MMDGNQPSLNEVWERVAPWIEAALKHAGTHDLEDIKEGILDGRFQLWPAPKAVLVTEIILYPKCRDLNLFLIGGDLEQVLDMEEAVEAYAKALGCRQLIGSGRPGWVRVLKKRGWKEPIRVMAKEIKQ